MDAVAPHAVGQSPTNVCRLRPLCMSMPGRLKAPSSLTRLTSSHSIDTPDVAPALARLVRDFSVMGSHGRRQGI